MHYVVMLITRDGEDMKVDCMGASSDKKKAEGLAERQRKYLAATQIIDVFEAEEIQ